ncbi:MAG: hypothetical protein KGM91_05960 [Burkholderiales bacterium]|nr:hypothetical protein [Burkholderiales bacterium]
MTFLFASMFAFGPHQPFTSPFALSLSKGSAELVEAVVKCAEGFDRLSPNGSLGPQADVHFMASGSREAQRED